MGISPVLDDKYFWNLLEILLGCSYTISKYFQICCVSVCCQSFSWLTSLLKLDKSRDISNSGWDIFLKFFEGIPGMFVHLFQIILNFMYVCQSVSWLTSLLKLFKYRDISSSGRDIFLKNFGNIPGMLVRYFQIITNFLYVCQSLSLVL